MKDNKTVVKANQFITAIESPAMTAIHRKIVARCVTIFDIKDISKPVTFTPKDVLGDALNTNSRKAIINSCDTLSRTVIREFNSDDIAFRPLFKEIKYNKTTKEVYFIFNDANEHLLPNLKSRYTKYNYDNIISLSSSFSIRIYEFACMGIDKYTHKEYSIDDLLTILSVDESSYYYKNFNAVKTRILDTACNEITDKTDISASWKVSKTRGKKVTHIKIFWSYKQKPDAISEGGKQYPEEVLTLVKQLLQINLPNDTIKVTVKAQCNYDLQDDDIAEIQNQSTAPAPIQVDKPVDKPVAPVASQQAETNNEFSEKESTLILRLKEIGITDITVHTKAINLFRKGEKVFGWINNTKQKIKDEGKQDMNKNMLAKKIREYENTSL